ncbi:hypothetical protein Plec18167_002873 [Paecilomyces lecythidis]|uniref:CENP-V/GFA domain-containing protein n=1 Tax=Paecilomyces lecythidis TaxID=3004212 RepID=A0ABR3Y3K9_9EURO
MSHHHLQGGCACGRNQYLIIVPENIPEEAAQVYFDSGRDHRRSIGAPLSAWLRVPLTWYQSHTRSYYPDESHNAIRRTFTPLHAPHSQRNFCGFCGTPLTYWTELPPEEADFMSVSVGSLRGEGQRLLEDLNLLPEDVDEEALDAQAVITRRNPPLSAPVMSPAADVSDLSRSYNYGTVGGIPWFEEMIEGSRLGRLMRSRRGVGRSDDQSTTIQWEITEWEEGPTEELEMSTGTSVGDGAAKRKREQATSEGRSSQ